MALNPWLVESIETFSFYCCPECTFRTKEDTYFEAHALQNHDQSKSLFLLKDIKIEPLDLVSDYKENLEVQLKEEIDPEFRCGDCGEQCRDLEHFNNHILYHKYGSDPATGQQDGPYKKGWYL